MKKDKHIEWTSAFKRQFENPDFQRQLEIMQHKRDKLLDNPDRRCLLCQAKGDLTYCFHCSEFICIDCHRRHLEGP